MALPQTVQGTDLVESATLFECGVASLLGSESGLTDKLIERNDPYEVLLICNNQITAICCCLKGLEEAVLKIIESGLP